MEVQGGGYTGTDTTREASLPLSPTRIAIAVFISLVFLFIKVKQCVVLGKANICNGKYKGLASLYRQT